VFDSLEGGTTIAPSGMECAIEELVSDASRPVGDGVGGCFEPP